MDWWLGEASGASAAVCVRATAPGDVVVSSASETVVAPADPGQHDGVVRLSLSIGAPTPITITEPGGGYATATLRPTPSSGGIVAWGGCLNAVRSFPDQLLAKLQVDAFVGLGDLPYAESIWNAFGLTTVGCDSSLENATNPVNYARHQQLVRRNPGVLLFGHRRPMYLVPDDHDIAINNAEFTELIQLGLDFPLAEPWDPDGRAQAQQIITAGTTGLKWYYQGNPVNVDADTDPDPFYYRFTVGDIEVFALSCINWGVGDNLMRIPDTGSMLGPKQKAWLFDRLAASTKPFKLILSPKQTLFATKTNVDSWRGNWGNDDSYSAEFREIADFIHAGAGWVVPGGVAWGSSDWHSPGVYASYAGQHNATADHVCINAVLAMDSDGIRSSEEFSPYTLWAINDPDLTRPTSNQGTKYWGVGVARVLGDQLVLSYLTKTGAVEWQGLVRAGENRVTV